MKSIIAALAATLAVGATFVVPVAVADDDNDRYNRVHRYAVTVTNLTRGQNMAPPAVIVHNRAFAMFTLGSPASPGLAQLAEAGNGRALLNEIAGSPLIYATAIGAGGIAPGASRTVEIETTRPLADISVGAMLGTTNDGFMAIHGVRLPLFDAYTVDAEAYDAGSEANSETCAFIPGPPCRDLNHNAATSEGYVHIHAGIHGGGGGLVPAQHDWRNPVAKVEIRRIR